MVYIYAFVGRLFFYPYLSFKCARLLPDRFCRILNAVFLLEFILSTLSLLLHRFMISELMSLVMSVNIYIFFALGYTTALLLLLNGGQWFIERLSRRKLSDYCNWQARYRLDIAVAALAVLTFVGVLYGGYRGGHDTVITRYTIGDTSREAIARIALITDLHIGEGVTLPHIRQVVDKTMALRPDLILFGGDYIDHDGKYARDPKVIELMRQLSAPDGVYFVPGNHEYRADSTNKFDWVKDIGFTLLRDSIVYPRGDTYSLIGRNDYVQQDRQSLDSLLAQLQPKPYNILLEHTPEGLDSLSTTPIDIALYGHTHAGQVFPYKYLLHLKYDLPYGMAEYGRARAIVSSGAGAAGALFRLGTRSEIVLITLYPR